MCGEGGGGGLGSFFASLRGLCVEQGAVVLSIQRLVRIGPTRLPNKIGGVLACSSERALDYLRNISIYFFR
jgi:hypothetical protein